ncbi:MAG: hypothetical protein R3336_10620, partial [Phycisphaeraceae bacterium]|nr:hypothetical protein [Phycisphaeraceae bacterium]
VGLMALLAEPATGVTRVLAGTLVMALAVMVWWAWATLARGRVTWLGAGRLGLSLGVFALAYPAAVLLMPVATAWAGCRRGGRAGFPVAGALALAAVLPVAPVTWHNVRASGNLIPISAHAGVTLAHGNAPAAKGVYAPVEGLDPGRSGLHASASAVYEQETGTPGSWSEIDRHFARRAINWWIEHPADALGLAGRKVWFYLTARNYHDIRPTALDRKYGLARGWWLAPLPTPWLFGLAGLGILALGRPWRRLGDLALPGLTLLVVVVFFYSPRYRLPIVPVTCVLAALGLVGTGRLKWPVGLKWVVAGLPLVAVGINGVTGFDDPQRMESTYRPILATSYRKVGLSEAREGRYD